MNNDNGTVELPRGKIVGFNWQIIKKLGEGGCGSVYLVKSLEDDSEAAMKAESNYASGGCVLKLEVAILKKLSGKQHVAQLICAARVTTYSYVIMTLLGDSLSRISKKLGRSLTVSSQARIAGNILFCLKQIHDCGFIHRDLKPANMALGRKHSGEARFFHVLDFGLARQFAVQKADEPAKYMMRRPRDRALFRGTTRYCSIRMHDRAEQGRVDDLWSMIYLLAELRGLLPWSNQNDKRLVGELKKMQTDETVLQNSPVELLEIARHLRTLTYFHRPDYYKYFMLINQIMEKGKYSWNDPFDWEAKQNESTGLFMKKKKKGSREQAETPEKSREKVSRSREVLRSREPMMSQETAKQPSKEASRETIGSREILSKELLSKERLSKENGGSAEVIKTAYVTIDKAEIMARLPFDPDFFLHDALGF